MTRSAVASALVSLAAALSVGCAGRARAAAPGALAAGGTCAGQQFVEVDNPLSQAVDVYAYVNDGPAQMLGTVSNGRSRLPVTGRIGYTYAMAGGTRFDNSHGNIIGKARPTVRFTKLCERAG